MTSFFGVPSDQVTFTGKVKTYASSPGVLRGFCGDCGGQLFYRADRWPNETHLFAVTLDDPTMFTPQAHFYWAEKLPWLTVTDDLPKHNASEDS